MDKRGKFETIRATLAETFTAALFTAVVALVVGGTTAMLVQPSALLA
jgi:hypothetical protein